MARSIDVGVGDRKTRSNTMAVPRPRKRGQAVSMVMDCTQIDLEIEELLSKLAVSVCNVAQHVVRSSDSDTYNYIVLDIVFIHVCMKH